MVHLLQKLRRNADGQVPFHLVGQLYPQDDDNHHILRGKDLEEAGVGLYLPGLDGNGEVVLPGLLQPLGHLFEDIAQNGNLNIGVVPVQVVAASRTAQHPVNKKEADGGGKVQNHGGVVIVLVGWQHVHQANQGGIRQGVVVLVIPLLLQLHHFNLTDGAQQAGKIRGEHPRKGLVEAVQSLKLLFGKFFGRFEVVFPDLTLLLLDVFFAGGHLFQKGVDLAL